MQRILFFTFFLISIQFLFAEGEIPLETVLQKGHARPVSCYAFSPDSKFVVTGSNDNSLILWDLESGRQIRVFNQHSELIYSVVFSPDGKQILTASKDNTAKIFQVSDGQLVRTFTMKENRLFQAYFSPDGDYVLLFDDREGVFIFDSQTGKNIQEFSRSYSLTNNHGIISPDGKRILSLGDYSKMYVCDLVKGDSLIELEFDKPYQFSYSPDGKYIAVSSAKLFTGVFDAGSGKRIWLLEDGDERCDGCNTKHVFSNSGKWLVTMSSKVDAILWDLSTGKKIKSFSDYRERPYNLVFSPDDAYVLISFDQDVFVYEVKSGKEKLHLNSRLFNYFEFTFSPDGSLIAVPGADNELLVYEVSSGRKKKSISGFLNKKKDSGLRFEETNWTDQRILKFIAMKKNVAVSPDGIHLALGNVDSSAFILDLYTGKIVHRLEGHHQVVFALDYSPDGKILATAGGDRRIMLWDTETGALKHVLKGHRELVFDLEFSADGKRLASGSWDGTARIWDLEDPGEYHLIDLGNVSPYSIGFTNNGLYLVTGDLDRNVDFWELDAGESFRTLIGHTGVISGFDFSPDGKRIITSSWDGKLKEWDILTGMLLGKYEDHKGPVYSVSYSPLGNLVASGGADNTIVLMEGNERTLLKGHTAPVTSLNFSQNGNWLVSCDADGMVKIWDVQAKKEKYSRMQISRSEWLAVTPGGYFDGSSKSLDLVNYVSGTEVLPISSLFDKYYTPDLIQKIMSGSLEDKTGENLHNLMKTTPLISFDMADVTSRSGIDPDSSITWNKEVITVGVRINSQGEGIDEIRIFNNGKLVVQEPFSGEVVFRGGAKDVRNFEVPLVSGENRIRAVAINQDRTESAPVEMMVDYEGAAALTDLFILTIGINQYKNPQYNLDYAQNDASSFKQVLTVRADSLFNEVQVFELYNEEATKPRIVELIKKIGEMAGPEDVFVFYYAGHGVMSYEKEAAKSEFFLVTHDVTNLYGDPLTLREKAISATELLDFSKQVSAAKQLFILDACHSGGALDALATRGDGREKTLAQLARSTGTFFITAAQDAEFANEVGDLQHGLFTYALLEVLNGEKGNNGDNKITISEMKIYVEERVPELSEQYHGSAQYPTSYSFGQDFPIVILK